MSFEESAKKLKALTGGAGKPRNRRLLQFRERLIRLFVLGCAIFSVATTVSIIFVLSSETLSFFRTNTSVASESTTLAVTQRQKDEATTLENWRVVDSTPRESLLKDGDFKAITTDAGTILVPSDELAKADASNPEVTGWKETGARHAEVGLGEFLGGTEWNPLLGEEKKFGIWPLISGTLLITAIAAVFALPIGLITAIFLSEYAPERMRNTIKPILEVLAGIPTVVFGFFALTVLTPGLNWMGALYNDLANGSVIFDTYNAMAAGLAVGIMILPIVSSLAEDALRAVPKSLRDGAFALGATRLDVSLRVVVPAALSGIMASFLLAITRAVGETMIVALAAGGLAQMAYDPTGPAQTMTAYMVQIFLGDAPATGVEYKSSYAVAAVLFLMTLALTITGNIILNRFREEYE